jgi:signal transduction histidine kinase
MAAQARRMGTDRLSVRLAVPNPHDEMGQLAETFNELLDRIESSFERTRQFVADASHELRTPVAVIRSEADVALTPPLSEDEAFEALDVILDESGRLTRLVDDMFGFASETVLVDDLVSSCGRRGESLGWSRGVTVEVRTAPHGEVVCIGDRLRLDRMLANLVDNATKYTPRGGHVWIDSELTRFEGRPAVSISVTDNGPGIATEHREKVFERFYCVDRARTREKGGSGLGLPIARWIAWSHGGTLTLENAQEHGCVFTVTLPVHLSFATDRSSNDEALLMRDYSSSST